jgi:hypothetical protein
MRSVDTYHGLALGWAGACPKGIRARSCEASAQAWDFQEECSLPTTMRAQAPGPMPKETMMRFYNQPHEFYCGVDLHARSKARTRTHATTVSVTVIWRLVVACVLSIHVARRRQARLPGCQGACHGWHSCPAMQDKKSLQDASTRSQGSTSAPVLHEIILFRLVSRHPLPFDFPCRLKS